MGGDCLADIGVVRAQPELFGPVASDPTVSRLIDTLAERPGEAIAATRAARTAARARAARTGRRSPTAAMAAAMGSDGGQVVVDLDATLIGAHSEKEHATPTFKRGFGFHPMLAFVDHGTGGTGGPLAGLLRPGNANANDAADQIAVLDAALAQLPEHLRSRVLVRGDSGSGVRAFLCLVGAVLAERNDEWADGRRYLGLELLAKARLVLITTETDREEHQNLGAITPDQTTKNHKPSYTT